MATAQAYTHRAKPLTVEQHLAQLSPRAARSYLAGYARAGLPLPLTEYQAAIVHARAALDPEEEPSQESEAGTPPRGPVRLTVA